MVLREHGYDGEMLHHVTYNALPKYLLRAGLALLIATIFLGSEAFSEPAPPKVTVIAGGEVVDHDARKQSEKAGLAPIKACPCAHSLASFVDEPALLGAAKYKRPPVARNIDTLQGGSVLQNGVRLLHKRAEERRPARADK